MLALYRSGRQADALEAYQGGRRLLVEQLGLDPGRSLQELERSILNHDPLLDTPVRAGTEATAAGSGRLAAAVFVGRDSETYALDAALNDARGGRGRLVVLSGEAGIGKSRLADELSSRAKQLGVRVLWGRCWEAGGAPAYWPWVQALRAYVRDADPDALRAQLGRGAAEIGQLLPELRELFPDVPEPASLDSDGAKFRLYDAAAAFLRCVAAERPLLVVLDDVHAADASSLLMLEFVAAELADARVLVLAVYRDPELDPGDPIAAALAGVGRHASLRVTLRGLHEPEVASFIEASTQVEPAASLVRAIAAETEGNPLFVGEIARLLAAEGRLSEEAGAAWRVAIPDTVKEVIGRRLNRLTDGCRQTLAIASVVGREFPLDLLERLTDRSSAELLALLDEAITARLVTEVPGSPGRLRFTHALVRDALYDALPQALRLDLHRHTGEALEEVVGSDPSRLSEVAHHFFHALPAVDADVAVRYAGEAAAQAGTLLAHEEAARLYETALSALELRTTPDPVWQRQLLLGLGEALARSGDTPRAQDAFVRAAGLARTTGAAEDLARAALGYGGRIAWFRASGDRLRITLLEEALGALGDEDTPLRARVLARLAGALRDELDPTRRLALGEEGVAVARRSGDADALSFALAGLAGAQHGLFDDPRRIEVIAELLTAAHAAEDKESECEAYMARMLVDAEQNDVDRIYELLGLIRTLAEELRQPSHQWFVAASSGMLAVHEGRFREAEELRERALALGGTAVAPEASSVHAIQLFILRREQARADEAIEELTRVSAAFPARPFFRCALAALLGCVGREADARRVFEELAANRFAVMPRDNEWLLSAAFLAEACCLLGDASRAEQLYEEVEPWARSSAINVPEGTLGTLARPLAGLARLLGREDDAGRLLETAIALDTAGGARPWAAHAQVDLAELLLLRGDSGRAHALLAEAGATAEALEATRLAQRVAAVSDLARER